MPPLREIRDSTQAQLLEKVCGHDTSFSMIKLQFASIVLTLLLVTGCDPLGVESSSTIGERRSAEGKAIGAGCRNSGRTLEDCISLNPKIDKQAVYLGWREMNDYMQEHNIENSPPRLTVDIQAQEDTRVKVSSSEAPEQSSSKNGIDLKKLAGDWACNNGKTQEINKFGGAGLTTVLPDGTIVFYKVATAGNEMWLTLLKTHAAIAPEKRTQMAAALRLAGDTAAAAQVLSQGILEAVPKSDNIAVLRVLALDGASLKMETLSVKRNGQENPLAKSNIGRVTKCERML